MRFSFTLIDSKLTIQCSCIFCLLHRSHWVFPSLNVQIKKMTNGIDMHTAFAPPIFITTEFYLWILTTLVFCTQNIYNFFLFYFFPGVFVEKYVAKECSKLTNQHWASLHFEICAFRSFQSSFFLHTYIHTGSWHISMNFLLM